MTFRAIAIGNDLSATGTFANFRDLLSCVRGFDQDSAGKMTLLKTPGIAGIQKESAIIAVQCESFRQADVGNTLQRLGRYG